MTTHRTTRTAVLAAAVAATLSAVGTSSARAQAVGPRVLGVDISEWQGNLSQTTWNNIKAQGRDFAFIRSSRGGTAGFYNQSDAANAFGRNTQGQRYDDFYFQQNMVRATNAGVYAGAYHFTRPDVVSYVDDYGNIILHSGRDEAIHFLQQARMWMKPGFLLPVDDLEAGAAEHSRQSLTDWHVEFANTIFSATGVQPIVYINQNYALNEIVQTQPNPLVQAMPVNWVARWPNQSNPHAIDVHNIDPPASPSTANVYGPYSPTWTSQTQTHPTPQPWKFWQYGSSNTNVAGISPVDVNVAHGNIEFLKDHLVPAMLTTDASANWSTIGNWNSDADPSGLGPAARLPGIDDTVILDRGAANPVITLSAGTQNIRKLFVHETLNVTGGTLNVGYVPYTPRAIDFGAGPITARFSNNVTLSGKAAYIAHTTLVDPNVAFAVNGGSLTFNTLDLARGANPARILLGGNIAITPLAGAAAQIVSPTDGNNPTGHIDLGGAARLVTLSDGAAPTDLTVAVPLTNGSFVKAGAGTMALTAANTMAGSFAVRDGTASLSGPSGTLTAATAYRVHPAGTLVLDNASSNNNNRIGTGLVSLLGGRLSFVGNTTTESAGDLAAAVGASTVALSGTSPSTLAFGAYSRSPGATLNFTGASTTLRATFSAGVAPGAFIDQGTFVNGADYAVYDAAGHVRAMTTGAGPNDYVTAVAADRHVRLSSTPLPVTSTTIRSLNLAGTGLSIDPGSTLTLSHGGIIKSGNGGTAISSTGNGSVAAPANVEIVINTAGLDDQLTFLVPLTGGSSLTKTGPGTLQFAHPNTAYAGPTTVAQGTLRLANPNVIPDNSDLTVGCGATFDLNGQNETLGNLTLHDGLITGGGAAVLTLGGANTTVTYNGLVSGGSISANRLTLGATAGTTTFDITDGHSPTDLLVSSILQDAPAGARGLTKTGAGTLALTGSNTFTGPLTVSSGTLSVPTVNPTPTAPQPLGASAAAITLTGGGILEYTGASAATLNRPVSILTDAGTIRSTGPLTLAGNLTGVAVAGPGPTLTLDADTAPITVTGTIGAVSLTKTGTHTLTLAANNTYAGGTTVSAGTLEYSTPSNLGALAGTITLDGGTLRPLSGINEPRALTVQTGGGSIDASFNPTFSGVFSGPGALTKTGSGTLFLTAHHAYTGPTNVAAGILNLSGSLPAASPVKVSSGATLAGTGTVHGAVTLTTGGRVNLSPSGSLASLTVVGPTGGTWAGAGSVSGPVTIPSGTLTIPAGANLTSPAGVSATGGTLAGAGTITANVTLASNDLDVATANFSAGATITGNLTVTGTSEGVEWNGQGAVNGTTTVAARTLYVNGSLSGPGGLTLASGTNLKGLGTVNKTLTLTGNNRLGGHSRLYKAPGGTNPQLGTLTITTPVNWTGPNLFVSSGTVATPGDTISGNLTVDSSPTVQHPTSGTLYTQYPGTLGGTGVATVTPTGTLRGPGTVAKPVSLQGGTINFTSAGALGPVGRITSTLGVTSGTWAGQGSVSGAVTHAGPGNFTLGFGASLTAPAGVTVTGGTLSGATSSTITGSLTYASNLPSSFAGRIAGASNTLTIGNGGALTLTGSHTYTGATTIHHGTLTLTNNNQLATSGITTGMTVVTPGTGGSGFGGTLQLANNVTYALPLTLGGAGLSGISLAAPGSIGALHSLSGTNTWSSNVTLAGTGSNGTDPLINQVSAAAGATLVLSGALTQAAPSATLAKSGDGDLVLRGAAPNTYNGLTRIYGGRLIVEKDGALGTDANHTFQLNSASTLAFRAPASSPGGFTYSLHEFLHTDGTGAPGFGQIDNLAGDNTFAGSIAVGGPSNVGSIGVSAGSLTLTGGLYARSGSAERTINKLGTGTLILTGTPSDTPASNLAIPFANSTLNVSAGTLDLRSPSPTAANVPGLSTYSVAPDATLLHTAGTLTDVSLTVSGTFRQSAARLHNASLSLTAGATTVLQPTTLAPSVLSSLTLANAATLDLTSNDLLVDYTTTSPADAVRQYLHTGRLTSSTAAADPQQRLALAYIDLSLAPHLSPGLTDTSALLLQTTWLGDADHDHAVTRDDFALIDRGFALDLTGWHNGDFNHDNAVDQFDYLLIDRVFHQQSGTLPSPSFLATRESQFGADYVSQLVASIPEPSSVTSLLTVLPFLRRCRRRQPAR